MTAAAAVVGCLSTDPESEWYQSIEKPPWQPPPVAFPLVWTPLYVAIAYGTGRMVEKGRPQERPGLLALTAADLVANAGWNRAFFRGRSPAGGLAVIAALNGLNAALVRRAETVDGLAAAALLPYTAWVGFATALNGSIWRRNRGARTLSSGTTTTPAQSRSLVGFADSELRRDLPRRAVDLVTSTCIRNDRRGIPGAGAADSPCKCTST